MKRFIAFLLVLVLALTFVGCKKNAGTDEQQEPGKTPSGMRIGSDLEPISTDSGEIRDTDMAEENP